MSGRNPPKAAANCDTSIEKILAFGRRKGITGTPTLFLAGGERVRGAAPLAPLKSCSITPIESKRSTSI
jgi:thiol:disulfide interchange protein DsbC